MFYILYKNILQADRKFKQEKTGFNFNKAVNKNKN